MNPESYTEETLTEARKQMLTEFIGECWHEIKRPRSEPTVFTRPCLHCKKHITVTRDEPIDRDHTFLTPDDQQACKDALKKLHKWLKFEQYCWDVWREGDCYNVEAYESFTDWLFHPVNEAGEAHFCALVAEFLGSKKKSNISYTYPGWPPADIPDGPYTGVPNGED